MMRRKTLAALGAAAIVWHVLSGGMAFGREGKKVILLIFDGVNLEDVQSARPPRLQELIKGGGIGLMNTRSARPNDRASGYLTIGAGVPADAGSKIEAGQAFNADRAFEGRPVLEIYRKQYRRRAGARSVLVLSAPHLVRNSAEESYGARPGLLGEALEQSGKRASVVGNADILSKHRREAALIAMDETGLVEEGNVERELLKPDEHSAFGISTNYEKLLEEVLSAMDRNDLTVVELGDTARANAFADFLTEEAYAQARREALLKGDEFLGRLLRARAGENDLVIVVSPSPPAGEKELPGRLTPLIISGTGYAPGLLTSPTTRREGLVANTDIAPTILEHLGVPVPEGMSGRRITSSAAGATVDFLERSEARIVSVSEQRRPVLTFYVAAIFALLVLGALSVALPLRKRIRSAIQFALVWALAVPSAFLLLPLLSASSLGVTALRATVFSGGAALLAWVLTRDFLRATGIVSGVTVFLISLDVARGAPLMKSSLLGYDPLIGARYYGLGNEYAGVLIGAALIGATILLDTYSRKAVILLPLVAVGFLFLIVLIGHPRLGADSGGIIAAAAAFLLALVRFRGRKLTFKNLALVMAAVIVMVSLFVAADYLNSADSQSHTGRAVSLIRKEGAKSALDIIRRKLATNLKLLQWTIWSKVFLVSLLIFTVVFAKPIGIVKQIDEKLPYLSSGIYAIISGSVVAFAFNDSGVVAAATMIIFGVVPLLHLLMDKERGLA